MKSPIRPQVLTMQPYSPGKPIDEVKRELGLERVVKLASNENPLGPSPKAVEAAKKAAEQMHIYPDAAAYNLREALSARFDMPMDQVIFGNGSDELIHYLGLIALDGPDTELVMGDPSFVRYEASAHISEAQLTKVPMDSDWRHDVKAMAARFSDKTRLVYIANPNNPTGTLVTAEEVDWLLGQMPEGALLVLDEAYYEFAADLPDYPDSLALIRAGKPVVSLRTFSKAYGLAGIRIGYGFASPEIVDAINRIREPFNANSLAQAAAIAALDDAEHMNRTVMTNRDGIRRITQKVEEMGFSVVPSWANFICIDLGQPAKPVFEALLKQGVIVRSGHVLGMPNHLRVSIGTEEEVDVFLKAFAESAPTAAAR